MILTELALENFGVYRGRTTFDLRPRLRRKQLRPVVLFGGKNGAGKTTVLEAIYLCLYGPLALGPRTTDVAYKDHLKKRIHRAPSALLQSSTAAVELEFEHTHVGNRNIYRVTRAWSARDSSVSETLTVTRDGTPIDDLAADHWQDFIKDLIPPGLASLCFFDGEKIRELAEDTTADEALRASVLALLGLDVVDQLQTDLRLYAARTKSKTADAALAEELATLELSCEQTRDALQTLNQDVAQAQTLLENATASQLACESALRSQGAGEARGRDQLQSELSTLREQIADAERRGREICQGVLPFSAAPRSTRRVRDRLDREAATAGGDAALAVIKKELVALRSSTDETFSTCEHTPQLLDRILEVLVGALKTDDPARAPLDVSAADRARVDTWLNEALGAARLLAMELAAEIERGTRREAELQSQFSQIPGDDVLAPAYRRLADASQLVGKRQSELLTKAEVRDSTRAKLDDQLRQIERMRGRLGVADADRTRFDRAERAQRTLASFRQKLVVSKVEELERHFVTAYQRLSRKEDLVRCIRLDPESLTVTLEDRNGHAVSRQELSAAEKQAIYAVSLLWALATASGRPLPFVIDTPLARLDSDHRRKLVNEYFPFASHQVIVLSTDTEVDSSFYDALQPHLSHAYHLEFDLEDECTRGTPGYFWQAHLAEEKIRAAQ